jgi:PPOX class probable F420-dependent enzyme
MGHSGPTLTSRQRRLLGDARRATLATIAPDGRPRLVPLAYAVAEHGQELIVYSALDEKPKSVADPRQLARVRDILARPSVALLVDEWHEDWDRLAWLRLDGTATVLEPRGEEASEHATAVKLLRARYTQYATHRLEQRPLLRIRVERATGWGGER